VTTRLPAVGIDILWRDGSGSSTISGCHRRSSEDIAAVDAAAISLCTRLTAASRAAIVGFNATWRFHVSDARPTSGIGKNYGATLIFSTTTVDEYVMIDILGIPTSYIVNGMIDITNASIVSISNNIISNGYCNPFGSAATTLIAAVPTFIP
jgi:hypothetical protein